jgi:3-dehydroquinate synthase class II
MYKISPKAPDNKSYSVIRLRDWAIIPFDELNNDYQEYLKWVAEGNTAEEYIPEGTE